MKIFSAEKNFETLGQAMEEIYLSYSLSNSDLRWIMHDLTSFDGLEDRVNWYFEEEASNCNLPIVSINGNRFCYETCSGKNSIEIVEEASNYVCKYEVLSEKPLEYSTSMMEFKEAGWEISSFDWTEEEEKQAVKEYEEDMLDQMRHREQIPYIVFMLFVTDDEIPSVTLYVSSDDNRMIKKLIKNHPELASEVKEIAKKQIKYVEAIECPVRYEFNEEVREDDFYVSEKEKVLTTLRELVAELS